MTLTLLFFFYTQVIFVILLLAGYQGTFSQVIANYSFIRQCLSGNDLKNQLRPQMLDTMKDIPNCPCGQAGKWSRIVDIDMSNSSQTCPPNWNLVSNTDVRGCGRSSWSTGSCDSAVFSSGGVPYTRVCGKINAVQYGQTEAFYVSTNPTWVQYQNLKCLLGWNVTL